MAELAESIAKDTDPRGCSDRTVLGQTVGIASGATLLVASGAGGTDIGGVSADLTCNIADLDIDVVLLDSPFKCKIVVLLLEVEDNRGESVGVGKGGRNLPVLLHLPRAAVILLNIHIGRSH